MGLTHRRGDASPTARVMDAVRSLWRPALIGVAASAFYVTVVLVMRARGWIPERVLFDMAALARQSPFTGILSNLGVLMMAATAAICLFAARLAPRDGGLLIAVGAFTTAIFADDFLMLHSNVLPRMIGLPALVIYGGYAGACAGFAWRFRRRFRGAEHLAVGVAIGCLGISVALDVAAPATRFFLVAEEGAKFVGYALWSGYWVARAHRALRVEPVAETYR